MTIMDATVVFLPMLSSSLNISVASAPKLAILIMQRTKTVQLINLLLLWLLREAL